MAGITNSLELKAAVSRNNFIQLKNIDPGACINILYALEGATREIRWHHPDKEVKRDLKEFCQTFKC
jgi:DNA transformation protein